MYCEGIRIKQDLLLCINLLIKYSVQPQIHLNANVLDRSNEGSLYLPLGVIGSLCSVIVALLGHRL